MDLFKYFRKEKLGSPIIENNIGDQKEENKTNSDPDAYTYREPSMFGVELKDWRYSVDTAWSQTNPDRIQLCDIYKAITTYDAQTIAAINQRKLMVMQGDINIYNEDGTINEIANKIIKTPSGSINKWFRDFISYSLDSIFWGFELVTINVVKNQIVVKKVPERNIIPCKNQMIKDTYNKFDTIDYTQNKYDLITCKISYTNDLNELGLLSAVAPYFFSKCVGSWKMHTDKFGMLTRILKTSSENKTKLTASYNALKNQVRGNFVILGQDDELTFEGDTRTQLPYKELNDYCDSNIAKIILGQSSTMDEKSFSGSANVHKEVLDSIIRSDREFIESVVNEQLIPKLQLMNILPNKVYFGIEENVNIDLKEQAEIVKLLTESGFKVDAKYIQETFNIPVEEIEMVESPIEKDKNKDKNNG